MTLRPQGRKRRVTQTGLLRRDYDPRKAARQSVADVRKHGTSQDGKCGSAAPMSENVTFARGELAGVYAGPTDLGNQIASGDMICGNRREDCQTDGKNREAAALKVRIRAHHSGASWEKCHDARQASSSGCS